MTLQAQLALAVKIASEAFEHKFDKGGAPYILHCLQVMESVRHMGYEAMIAGVLHDLLEDTDWKEEDLLDQGFDRGIVATIVLLTRKDGEDYLESYIKRIATDEVAVEIKKEDLHHNMDPARLRGLTAKDFARMEKYQRAYVYLSEV